MSLVLSKTFSRLRMIFISVPRAPEFTGLLGSRAPSLRTRGFFAGLAGEMAAILGSPCFRHEFYTRWGFFECHRHHRTPDVYVSQEYVLCGTKSHPLSNAVLNSCRRFSGTRAMVDSAATHLLTPKPKVGYRLELNAPFGSLVYLVQGLTRLRLRPTRHVLRC